MKHNWEYKRLGDVCTISSARRVHQADWTDSGVPFYRAREIVKLSENGSVDNELFISQSLYDELSKSGKPKAGDIMLSAVGTLGATYIVQPTDHFYYKDASVICLGDIHSLQPEFLCYLFDSNIIKQQISRQAKGATVGTITISNASKFQVPVPPMEVQERIVAELDKINEVIEDCRKLLRNLDALSQSLFYDYFGDPVSNPKGLEKKTLGTISTVSGGSTPKTNIDKYWDGDLCWITPAELKGEKYIYDTDRHITEAGRASANLQIFPVDTVLLTSRAPIGKVAIAKTEMYCNQGFKNLICDAKQVHFQYVYFFLSLITDVLNEKGSGATFKEISKRVTESIEIPVPPLSLQEKFAERIEQIEAQKRAVEETIANLKVLLDSRMDYWFN